MSIHTQKIYYEDPFLYECEATVQEICNNNEVCLDRTVAYPEGGGQISDVGIFSIDNCEIPFHDVKKGYGRVLNVKDFPTVNVDTPVYHIIDTENIEKFYIGQKLKLKIDINHRMWTTLHHSAIHLALMVASELRGDLYHRIKGCNITTEHARLDFSLSEKFSADEINIMNEKINELIAASVPVIVFPYKGENEAWFWQCKEYICPCGGTHITNTSQIGHATIKRKTIGKGSERIIVTVDSPNMTLKDYHAMRKSNG